MFQWYVVYTKLHGEWKASLNLRNQGFNVYLPVHRKVIRHARQVRNVSRPLFPRYLFLQIDPSRDSVGAVTSTRGVSYIVSTNGRPLAVRDSIVEEIRGRETEEGFVSLAPKELAPGDSLRFVDGALADKSALFEEMDGKHRAVLLLKLLGQSVRVHAPMQYLAAT